MKALYKRLIIAAVILLLILATLPFCGKIKEKLRNVSLMRKKQNEEQPSSRADQYKDPEPEPEHAPPQSENHPGVYYPDDQNQFEGYRPNQQEAVYEQEYNPYQYQSHQPI